MRFAGRAKHACQHQLHGTTNASSWSASVACCCSTSLRTKGAPEMTSAYAYRSCAIHMQLLVTDGSAGRCLYFLKAGANSCRMLEETGHSSVTSGPAMAFSINDVLRCSFRATNVRIPCQQSSCSPSRLLYHDHIPLLSSPP